MVSFPPCKINLGLQIISRRPDGYHNLVTCFYPIPWTDVLEVLPALSPSLIVTGFPIPGPLLDNLCLKAYDLLKADYHLPPVQAHLHKIIPAGAGLGGGSSDAAHILRILNSIFALDLSADQLMGYAARIGSDCAFFVQDKPMIGTGRGDMLTPANVNLKGFYLVLINPEIHISTAQAFAGSKPGARTFDLMAVVGMPVAQWRGVLMNDFEASVFQVHPAIQAIKEKFYDAGAVYASMSGSGSSVFGLFETETDSERLFNGFPGWSGWL